MTYTYGCPKCGKQFNIDKGMNEATRKEACPACSTEAIRVFSSPSFAIKCDGFFGKSYDK